MHHYLLLAETQRQAEHMKKGRLRCALIAWVAGGGLMRNGILCDCGRGVYLASLAGLELLGTGYKK